MAIMCKTTPDFPAKHSQILLDLVSLKARMDGCEPTDLSTVFSIPQFFHPLVVRRASTKNEPNLVGFWPIMGIEQGDDRATSHRRRELFFGMCTPCTGSSLAFEKPRRSDHAVKSWASCGKR